MAKKEMNKVKIPGKTNMSEVDLIIHILASLPEEYEHAVCSLEDRMMSKTEPLDLETVREKLKMRHDRIKEHDADHDQEKAIKTMFKVLKNEEDEEKAFAFFRKQFKGTCHACRQYGHKSTDPKCPELRKKQSEKT